MNLPDNVVQKPDVRKAVTIRAAPKMYSSSVRPSSSSMVRGKGLFSGYYKNDIATQESFDSDGWLHTGDIGAIDKDGYLTIQGRKKDTFKTAKGKFVSPVPIEKKLFEYSRVEMMCLIGLGLPGPILLVVPHDWLKKLRASFRHRLTECAFSSDFVSDS